jgi:hypothetical protein
MVADLANVPCRQCGAPLPLDLETGLVRCGFCRSSQRLEGPAVERVRVHLGELRSLAAEAEQSRGDAELYRRRGSTAWSLTVGLLLNAAMVGAGWAGTQVARWLEPRIGSALTAVVLFPAALAALFAILAGWAVLFSYRGKREAVLPAVAIGRARCSGCGATLPVKLGTLPRCPFCHAELLLDEVLAEAAEGEAQAYAQRAADDARAERLRLEHKVADGIARGRVLGNVWAGLCIGSLVGMVIVCLVAIGLTGQDPMRGSGSVPLGGAAGGALLGALVGLRLARRAAARSVHPG